MKLAPGREEKSVLRHHRRSCRERLPAGGGLSVPLRGAAISRAASVAAILTGMGNDGTAGLRLLKRGGCFSIAQDEASCVVFGMPKEAIRAGVVDTVAPLDRIAAAIVRSVREGQRVIRLLPEEHRPWPQYIYSICAVTLDESKGYLIEGRLGQLVEETGCGSFGGLLRRAQVGAAAARWSAASSMPSPPTKRCSFATPRPSICCATKSFRS